MKAVIDLDGGIDQKSREVRIGLVMYGGVSLAIYINGVAHEFFRAVRGQGIYRLIKALTDSDIVVDVISGTSAGGINGIMMSYALCNERDFAASATLWRMHGDIAKLLRSPKSITTATSLLDSEDFYQPKLEEVFHMMPSYQPEPDEDNSPFLELDLFVTATDVDGTVYTELDDAGHAIDVKNHRSVFILSHRDGRKEPFRTTEESTKDARSRVTVEALAKLSRATSCFPAAFAPVHVDKRSAADDTADDRLQHWGNLGKEAFFLDGGVLDNKPFTYTLKSIFSRTADREVDRRLFYIEPDPETFSVASETSAPSILQAVLAALIGIPGYESISDDLRLLASRNSKLQQYKRMVAGFGTSASAPSSEVNDLYARSRLIALSERILRGIFRVDGRDETIGRADRERAAELVRDFDSRHLGQSVFDRFDVSYRIRRIARAIYMIPDLLYTDASRVLKKGDAQKLQQLWRALNCLFKLYEIIESAMERLIDEAPIPWREPQEAGELWKNVSAALLQLLDDSATTEQLLPKEDVGAVRCGKEDWLSPSLLSEINVKLRERTDRIIEAFKKQNFNNALVVSESSLLTRLDTYEQQLIEQVTIEGKPILNAWSTFGNLDAHLFPLEMLGGLHEKDIIETVRISPRDATRGFSRMGLSDKVAGDAIYHFGGFFKRSWRSNDILWGRLDGLCQIVETLLSRDRIETIVQDDAWRAKLQRRFFQESAEGRREFRPALDPERLFPKAGARTHKDLRLWLEALLSDEDTVRKEALQPDAFEVKLNLLVEAAQLEIVDQDLPKVLADAIGEQAEWNAFKVLQEPTPEKAREELTKTLQSSPFTFQGTKGALDPFFTTMAVAERTRLAMATFDEDPGGAGASDPGNTRLGKFFKESYRVGAEQLGRDVPPAILLELLAHALLVVRNCVVNIFPPQQATRIRGHLLYRFGLSLPLRIFHAIAVLNRRAPPWRIAIAAGIAVSCIAALAIAALWRDPLLYSDHGWNLGTFVALVLLPLALLFLEGIILMWLARGSSSPSEKREVTPD